MGRIQSNIGLITGVPITDTVDQLIAISARPRDTLIGRNNLLQQEQTAVAELTAAVLAVQFAARGFGESSLFSQRTVSSSNSSLLSVTSTGTPAAGNYQFTPLQTSQSHQLLSRGVASLEDAVGEGSITIGRGGFVDEAVELSQLNSGVGVARGNIRITDRSGSSAEIDLRFAVTIDDVVAAINETSSIDVTAAAEGDRLTLTDNTGQTTSNLQVAEVNSGTTASDLGLGGIDVAASSAAGSDVISVHNDSRLVDLLDGRGLNLRNGLADLEVSFRDGSANLQIDFSTLADPDARGSATLEDLLDVINAADPARLSAAISADGDRIELTDLTAGGGTFAVTSPLSGTLAEELGLTGTAVAGVITGGRLHGGLNTTLLTSLGGGQSLGTLGELALTDRTGATDTVNLSAAETLQDVIDTINAASVGITAQVNARGSGLTLIDTTTGTGNLIAANTADGTDTADKLNLAASVAADSITGGTLNRATVSRQTTLTDFNDGAGVASGKFVLTDTDDNSAVIDISDADASNLGDVIDLINAAGIGVTASINNNGAGLLLTDTAGGSGTLTVAANGNDTTAADLLILGSGDSADSPQTIDGATSFTVDVSDTDTLQDVADKINALNADVSASLLNDGSGAAPHRLSLVSGQSGLDGQLLIDVVDTPLTFDDIVAARDARLLFGSADIGGVLASSSDNTFNDLLAGVALTVTGSSTDTVTVSVSDSDSSLVSSVNSFVTQYNNLQDKLEELTFFNEETNQVGFLFGSNEALRVETELADIITGRINGAGSIRSLESVGLSVDEDGKLSLDQSKLEAKFAEDSSALEEFFTTETTGLADRLDTLTEQFAGAGTSLLVTRSETLSRKIDFNNERIDFLTERLDRERELLLTQFFQMESIIATLQNNLTALSSIAALPPLTSTASSSTSG